MAGPTPKSNCAVVIESATGFVPVVGINQAPGGYFMNYYLNQPHSLFGSKAHDSRHKTLVASRQTESHDLFTASVSVTNIDDRLTPETLPAAGITKELFLDPVSAEKLATMTDYPLIIREENVQKGILVRVTIWPTSSSPSDKDMEEQINTPPHFEPLIQTFTPSCFTNKVCIGVFHTDTTRREFPFFIDTPLTGSKEGEAESPPITFRGPKKGRS